MSDHLKHQKRRNVIRHDGVVVSASAAQLVDLGSFPLLSHSKTLKNGIYSFPARRSAFREGCGEQAGRFNSCVLGQGTFMRKTAGPKISEMATPKRVRTFCPKYSDTIRFLVNGG